MAYLECLGLVQEDQDPVVPTKPTGSSEAHGSNGSPWAARGRQVFLIASYLARSYSQKKGWKVEFNWAMLSDCFSGMKLP